MDSRRTIWRITLGEFANQLQLHGIDPAGLSFTELARLQEVRRSSDRVAWSLFVAIAEASADIGRLRRLTVREPFINEEEAGNDK